MATITQDFNGTATACWDGAVGFMSNCGPVHAQIRLVDGQIVFVQFDWTGGSLSHSFFSNDARAWPGPYATGNADAFEAFWQSFDSMRGGILTFTGQDFKWTAGEYFTASGPMAAASIAEPGTSLMLIVGLVVLWRGIMRWAR